MGRTGSFRYRDDGAAAAAVVTGIEADGGTALAVRADVSVEDDVVSAFAVAAERLGPVTGLVANAGIVAPRARRGRARSASPACACPGGARPTSAGSERPLRRAPPRARE